MKIATEQFTVERSNDFKESTFKINANAKAFSILSSGLYTDKIAAIIRELSANAWDSHKAAATTIPFVVHLPNQFEPEFSIRDFGTGLSHDDITNLYTTYFFSDKTDSNDFIGAMGLGSKSPFSYCQNFSVTSFFQGRRYIYSMFLSEQQIPSVALLDESFTDEQNGLLIQIPVKTSDFKKFQSEAANQFRHYTDKPEIRGAVVEFSKPSTIHKNFTIYKGEYSSYGLYIIMGNIAYKVDTTKINLTHKNNLILYKIINENRNHLYIRANIGEVGINASREEVEYTPTTISVLNQKVHEAGKEVKEQLELELNQQPSFWEACKYAKESTKYNGLSRYIQYRNKTIRDYFSLSEYFSSCYLIKKAPNISLRFKFCKRGVYNHSFEDSIFLDQDLDQGSRQRIISFVEELLKNSIKKLAVFIVKFKSDEVRQSFFDEFNPPKGLVIKVSSLPKPPKVRLPSSEKVVRCIVYNYVNGDTWNKKRGVSLPKDGFYVLLPNAASDRRIGNKIDELLSVLSSLTTNFHNKPIYGLRQTYYNKVKAATRTTKPNQSDGVVTQDFFECCKSFLLEELGSENFTATLPYFSSYIPDFYSEIKFLRKLIDKLPPTYELYKTITLILSVERQYKRFEKIRSLSRLLDSKDTQVILPTYTDYDWTKKFLSLYEQYPFLEIQKILYNGSYSLIEDIDKEELIFENLAQYVESVDNKNH